LKPSSPLVALVAAAAALALVAAYATVNSDRSYYAYGDITSKNEAVNIKVNRDSFTLSAGGQGAALLGKEGKVTGNNSASNSLNGEPFILVERQGDVENVKLLIRWVNARQVARYFDYVKILFILANKQLVTETSGGDTYYYEKAVVSGGQVKGFVTLRKPVTIITLDDNDFNFGNLSGNADQWVNNTKAVIFAKVYYEGKEGMMETNLPLIFNVKLLQTS